MMMSTSVEWRSIDGRILCFADGRRAWVSHARSRCTSLSEDEFLDLEGSWLRDLVQVVQIYEMICSIWEGR